MQVHLPFLQRTWNFMHRKDLNIHLLYPQSNALGNPTVIPVISPVFSSMSVLSIQGPHLGPREIEVKASRHYSIADQIHVCTPVCFIKHIKCKNHWDKSPTHRQASLCHLLPDLGVSPTEKSVNEHQRQTSSPLQFCRCHFWTQRLLFLHLPIHPPTTC